MRCGTRNGGGWASGQYRPPQRRRGAQLLCRRLDPAAALILTPEQDQRYRISVPLAMRSLPALSRSGSLYRGADPPARGRGLYRRWMMSGAVRLAEQTLFHLMCLPIT